MPPEDEEDEEEGNEAANGEEEEEEEEEEEMDSDEEDIASWVISSGNHSKRKARAAPVPASNKTTASVDRPVDFKPSKNKKQKVEQSAAPTNKPAKQSVSVSGLTKAGKKRAAKK
jgi:hypothetical protein